MQMVGNTSCVVGLMAKVRKCYVEQSLSLLKYLLHKKLTQIFLQSLFHVDWSHWIKELMMMVTLVLDLLELVKYSGELLVKL